MEMVESEFGYEMVDLIITNSKVPRHGAYTSVGTYNHTELFALVQALGKKTGIPLATLLFQFGQYMFKVFVQKYPHYFEKRDNAFAFLADVEHTIHVEVQKLYPEAELPGFEIKWEGDREFRMLYTSNRKMADFAEGLIVACLSYFGEKANVTRKNVEEKGTGVLFTITKVL